MANRTGKRGATAPTGELDLLEVMRKGEVTQRQIDQLAPFFDELKEAIHNAWEKLAPGDEDEARIYHHQLYAINKLMQIMKIKVVKATQAKHKLEEQHVIN